MAGKSVELAIFWLPIVAGVLLGGVAASAWYGGDRIPAIWIAFFGAVCLLLTGAIQVQQYAYANLVQPEIDMRPPTERSLLSWDPPKSFWFSTRAESQNLGGGESRSPIITYLNKSNIVAQDATATWTLAPRDNATLIAASARLQEYKVNVDGPRIVFAPGSKPGSLPVPSFTFVVSSKSAVPIPFITRQQPVESYIPYDAWSQALLFFMATLPDGAGQRSAPVNFDVALRWNVPEGSKTEKFKVTAIATNTSVDGASPKFSASIELHTEKVDN